MFSQQLASLVIHTVGGSGEKAGVVGGEKRGDQCHMTEETGGPVFSPVFSY